MNSCTAILDAAYNFTWHVQGPRQHTYTTTYDCTALGCRNEDFYEVKAAGKCPDYDVLVTNPPFSGDHLERIFKFAVKSNK
jgi:hypothetical protein